jgi:hypothetical protein
MSDNPVLRALDAFIAGFDRPSTAGEQPEMPEKPVARRETYRLEEITCIDENLLTSGSKNEGSQPEVYTFSQNVARARRRYVSSHRTGFFGFSGLLGASQFSAQRLPLAPETPEFASLKAATRWHLEHGERVPSTLCAGCRQALGDVEVLDLADGNRVHLDPAYRCLIAWGEVWRSTAEKVRGARHE